LLLLRHWPSWQVWPEAQPRLQPPQWRGLLPVSTQLSPQVV
jgi:hypothetical protein